jgi:hypothetical protein
LRQSQDFEDIIYVLDNCTDILASIGNSDEEVKNYLKAECESLLENIDALDIYWFVTFDTKHKDLPGFVESLLIQRFFEIHGKLPLWNKDY